MQFIDTKIHYRQKYITYNLRLFTIKYNWQGLEPLSFSYKGCRYVHKILYFWYDETHKLTALR